MLGFIFRGLFLIGILSWYSTHVWKLIDNYFKEQFRNYLEEEFRKNPRLRPDAAVGKINPSTTEQPPIDAQLRKIVEACDADVCPVGELGTDEHLIVNDANDEGPVGKIPDLEPEGTNQEQEEKEDTRQKPESDPDIPGLDRSTDQEIPEEPLKEEKIEEVEIKQEDKPEKEVPEDIAQNQTEKEIESSKETTEETEDIRKNDYVIIPPTESPRKRQRLTRKPWILEEQRTTKKQKKKRVKTLILTEEDFASARREEDDFWEFEEDPQPIEGILVSHLPFKPRLEIGELERVTADEFCPLTLEDQDSCDQIRSWP